jgi:hypothetical protein
MGAINNNLIRRPPPRVDRRQIPPGSRLLEADPQPVLIELQSMNQTPFPLEPRRAAGSIALFAADVLRCPRREGVASGARQQELFGFFQRFQCKTAGNGWESFQKVPEPDPW